MAQKGTFTVSDGENEEEVYLETTADMVKYTNRNGDDSLTAQEALRMLAEAFSIEGTVVTIDFDKLGGV